MVKAVAAALPPLTDLAKAATVWPVTRGRSPLSTTTGPSLMPVASRATLTAWPVPRRSACSTHSTVAVAPA